MFIHDSLSTRDIFVLIAWGWLGWHDCAELLHPPGKLVQVLDEGKQDVSKRV